MPKEYLKRTPGKPGPVHHTVQSIYLNMQDDDSVSIGDYKDFCNWADCFADSRGKTLLQHFLDNEKPQAQADFFNSRSRT